MSLKQITKIAVFTLVLTGLLFALKSKDHAQEKAQTIAILQTASHPALDLVRENFVKSIRSQLGENTSIIVQNAEGIVSQAHAMAKSFQANPHVRLIFTIATPATQVMANIEHKKPIVFAAVTDPDSLGIPKSHPNITGVRDMIDVDKEIALLQQLLPSIKTVALLFNPSEVNSSFIALKMKKALELAHIKWIEMGIHQESEAASSATMAARKAEAILCPVDNTVAAAIQAIVHHANKAAIPLIVSDNLLVEKGALAAHGIDYAASGRKAAALAVQILSQGKQPADLQIETPIIEKAFINLERVKALDIQLPQNLLESSTLIEGGRSGP